MPLAPALLSTTTACLVCSVIDWPSARASWSVALPAANGTMKVIGLGRIGLCLRQRGGRERGGHGGGEQRGGGEGRVASSGVSS